MPSEPDGRREPARVAVRAADPLVRAGLHAYLRPCRLVTLVESDHRDADVLVTAGASISPQRKVSTGPGRRHDPAPEVRITGVTRWGRTPDRGRPWATVVMPLMMADLERVRRCVAAMAAGDLSPVISEIGARRRKDRRSGQEIIKLMSPEALCDREVQALRLLADGFEGPQIAAHLGCSARQANYIVKGAVDRLGARNRLHAVAVGIARGLI